MDQETIRQLIQKYRSQIEPLQNAVTLLESELSQMQGGTTDQASGNGAGAANPPKSADGEIPVRAWEFATKSQTEAAEEVLTRAGHPMSISDLLDAVERGGAKVGGNTPLERRSNLGTQMRRSGKFGMAARGTWGLVSWRNIKPVKSGKRADSADEPETKAE